MVQAISGIRTYVSAVPSITQQERVNKIKFRRSEVTDNLRNGNVPVMEAMAQKTNIDTELSNAKAGQNMPKERIEYVPVTKPTKLENQSVKEISQASDKAAIRRQETGKDYSNVESQQKLFQQMSQMAINNQVLHGLVAV